MNTINRILFLEKISNLKKFINSVDIYNRIVAYHFQDKNNDLYIEETKIDPLSISYRKVYEYNSYIITLYGLYERFIENCVKDYISDICKSISKYEELPEKIIKNHISLSIKLINEIKNPKYIHLSEKNIIEVLNNGLNNNIVQVNIDAFTIHSSNFKKEPLGQFFNDLGINDFIHKLIICTPFKYYLSKNFQVISNKLIPHYFSILDDFVQRRNDIAHGVESIQLLSKEIIIDYINYVAIISLTIFQIMENEFLAFQYELLSKPIEIINVYNNSILCAKVENIDLKIGDKILIKKPDTNYPNYIEGTIIEIQIDNKPIDTINITKSTNIGMKINKRIKANYEFKFQKNIP